MPRPDRIMENNNRNNNNGSGFLLGVIVGVILTLLFTTKKGREILKEVLEKGVERFSNLEDLMRESYDEDDEDLEGDDDFIPTEPVKEVEAPVKKVVESKPEQVKPQPEPEKEVPPPTLKVVEKKVEEKASEESVTEKAPPAQPVEKPKNKRWFRGLRKKS
jgi:gas vesicle protein